MYVAFLYPVRVHILYVRRKHEFFPLFPPLKNFVAVYRNKWFFIDQISFSCIYPVSYSSFSFARALFE